MLPKTKALFTQNQPGTGSNASDSAEGDIVSLRALLEDGPVKHSCVVSLEPEPRFLEKRIEVLPWQTFVRKLWAGRFV